MNSKSPEGEKVGQGIEFYPESTIFSTQNIFMKETLTKAKGMDRAQCDQISEIYIQVNGVED